MGKDIEIDDGLDDDLDLDDKAVVEKAEIPGKDDGDDEPPKDLRSALKHAFKEQAEESDKDDKPEKEVPAKKAAPKEEKKVAASGNVPEKSYTGEVSPEKKLAPPPGWTKEGKANWESLSPDAQKSVIKREEEFSRGIAQYSAKAKAYDELEQVIAPRRKQIDSYGVTPVQVVDRLFQWMEGLAHPDPNYKASVFKALAQSFGVNLAQQTQRVDPQLETDVQPATQTNEPPPWFHQYANNVQGEVNQLKQQIDTQKQSAATSVLMNWAKDKSHFEEVRPLMYQLISSGIVPVKPNGEVDLDAAYEKAIKLNPEVLAQVEAEAQAKAKVDAEAQAKKEAALAAARLAKAKKAGMGFKPSAPSMQVSGSGKKPNGAAEKVSVRDSLKSTLRQLNE